MTTNLLRPSARIYEFPQTRAAGTNGPVRSDKGAATLRTERRPDVEFGSGWYHEAALQDADRTRKS